MTHKSSSRGSGAGGTINTLEIPNVPAAVAAGAEYYLTSEGAIISETELLPFVANPLTGTALTGRVWAMALGGTTTSSSFRFKQPDAGNLAASKVPGTALYRVPLVAPFVMYLAPEDTTNLTSQCPITCFVYNEVTQEKVAELLYTTGDGTNTGCRGASLCAVSTGANKVGLLTEYTSDGGSTIYLRVVEFTFNGTNAVTAAMKTVLGSGLGTSGSALLGVGYGVSAGKVAISRPGTTYHIVNLIGNTINTAAGFTTPHITEGQYGLTFGASNQVTVANYETNGSSSFTVTGASFTASSYVLRLAPLVYLLGWQGVAGANNLRLVVFNSGFTSGVCTILTNPAMPELASFQTLVVQPRSNVLEFLITSPNRDSTAALAFTISSSGAIVKACTLRKLDYATQLFLQSFSPYAIAAKEPLKLDKSVFAIYTSIQDGSAAQTSVDYSSCGIVSFRPDFYLGAVKPKYLGRALATVAQGALATFMASPALLRVDPVLTAFTRTGRVIKVNDLQGFFYDLNAADFGIVMHTETGPGFNQFNLGVDETGLNYPLLFGTDTPVATGEAKLVGPAYNSTSTNTLAVLVTPLGLAMVDITTGASAAATAVTTIKFTGFMYLGLRASYNGAIVQSFYMTATQEEADYV